MIKGFCPLGIMIVWFKRATGIGYKKFPPLEVDTKVTRRLKEDSDDLVVQLEQLERDLRRRGHLPPHGKYDC